MLVVFLYVETIPLIIDDFQLIRKGVRWENIDHDIVEIKTSTESGVVRLVRQTFLIKGDEDENNYTAYLSSTLVYRDKKYEIYYLSRSRQVLKINRLLNRRN